MIFPRKIGENSLFLLQEHLGLLSFKGWQLPALHAGRRGLAGQAPPGPGRSGKRCLFLSDPLLGALGGAGAGAAGAVTFAPDRCRAPLCLGSGEGAELKPGNTWAEVPFPSRTFGPKASDR